MNNTITLPRAQNAFDRAQKKLQKRLTVKELAQIKSVSGIDHLIDKAQTIGMHLENDKTGEFKEWVNKQAANLKPFERLLEGACKLSPIGGDLVWGSVAFLLEAARDKKKILEEVLDFFLSMANEMKYLQTVEATFPDSSIVADVVEAVYVAVLEFWVKAVQYYQQKLRRGILSRMKNYVLSTNMALEFSQLKEEIIAQKRTLHYMESVQHHAHEEFDRAERRAYDASGRVQQQIKAIIKWIDAPNYDNDLRVAYERRYGETCEWLGRKSEFEDWMDRRASSFLVIYGIPGAGKTILSSWIIKQVQALSPLNTSHMTIYHYFKETDNGKNTSLAAVRSFLEQTYTFLRTSSNHALVSTFEQQLMTHSERQHIDFEPLWDIFSSTLIAFSNPAMSINVPLVSVILDALDECTGSKQLVRRLRNLVHDASGLIRVVVTARPSGDHVGVLDQIDPEEYQPTFLHISEGDVQHDIASFTKYKIWKIPRLQPEKHQTLRNRTIAALSDVRSNQGMFLWVHFMCKEVKHLQKPKEIRELLNNLPPGLDVMYERICKRLLENDPRDRSLGILVLQWVFASKRPMQFKELEVALRSMQTYTSGERESEQLVGDDNELLWSREDIVKSCGDLVRYSYEGDTFAPVHLSAQQFFSSSRSILSQRHAHVSFDIIDPFLIDMPDTELMIATTCLKYILSTSPSSDQYLVPVGMDPTRTPNQDRLRKSLPLLDYAVMYWAEHILDGLEAQKWPSIDVIKQRLAAVPDFTRSRASLIWLEELIRLTYLEFTQNTIRRFMRFSTPVELSHWLRLAISVLLDFSRTLSDKPQMVRLCIQQMTLSASDDYQAKDEVIQPLEVIGRGWIHYDPSTNNVFSADAYSYTPMLRCQVMKTGIRRRPLPAFHDQHRPHLRLSLCSAVASSCSRFIAVMYNRIKSQDVFITCWHIDAASGTSDWATVVFHHSFGLRYAFYYMSGSACSLAFTNDGTLVTPDGVFSLEKQECVIQPATLFGIVDFPLWLSGDGKRFIRANRKQFEVFNINGTSVFKHEVYHRSSLQCFSRTGTKLVIGNETELFYFLVDDEKKIRLPLPSNDWRLSYGGNLQFTDDETKLYISITGGYKEGLGLLTFSDKGDVHASLIYMCLETFNFCLVPRTPSDSSPEVVIVDNTTGIITRQSSSVSWPLDVDTTVNRKSRATRALVVKSGKLVVWSLSGAVNHSQQMMHIEVWNLQTRQLERLASSKAPVPDQITIRKSFILSPGGDRIFDGLHIIEAQMSPNADVVGFGVLNLDLPDDRVPHSDQDQNYLLDGVAAYSKDGTRLAYLHYSRSYVSPVLHIVELATGPQIIRQASFPIDEYHREHTRMSEIIFSYHDPDLLAIGQYVLRFKDESLVVQTEIDGDLIGFTICGSFCCTEFSSTPRVWPLHDEAVPKTSVNSGFLIPPPSLSLNRYYVCLPYILGLKLIEQVIYLQRRLIGVDHEDGAHLDRPVCVLPDRLDFPTSGDDDCDLVWPDKDGDNLKLVFVRKGVPGLIDTGIRRNELMKEDEWC